MNSKFYKENAIEENQEIQGEESNIPDLKAEFFKEKNKLPKLLLHSCCGPCSTAVIERLIDDYDVTVFFYNPNVTDNDEYQKRREAQQIVIDYFNSQEKYKGVVKYIEGEHDVESFIQVAKGLEIEPEGGKRCEECFVLRLEETAKVAATENYDIFATTLTVSPHKNFDTIGKIGKDLSFKYNVEFLNGNFKKKDGFKRSIELSKKLELYRQNYCGCIYSIWE